jgi:hypothetical protein
MGDLMMQRVAAQFVLCLLLTEEQKSYHVNVMLQFAGTAQKLPSVSHKSCNR